MEIGGDWYDVFRLPEGRMAVTVGDVMGKGLTAAAGMGRVRNALRALALTDSRPIAVLAGLDRLFTATEAGGAGHHRRLPGDRPGDGRGTGRQRRAPALRSCIAPDGKVILDPAEAGTPLGWASPRKQHAFRMPPGSTAVFYSDGLVENRMRGLDVGLEDLLRVASGAPADVLGTPGLLLQYLLDHVLAGHEQDDDVTVLIMHIAADGAGITVVGGQHTGLEVQR